MPYEPVLLARINKPNSGGLEGYRADGGYSTIERALKEKQPADVVAQVKDSGLRGRGGAGFPCGLKWTFLPKDHPGPIYLCVNADESEPCTYNNRILMEKDPHQVLEGIMLACYAIKSQTAYFYVRYEYGDAYRALQAAIDELYAAGLLGKNILGSGFDLDIFLHRGAGAYICGEETGLIESLEGKRAWPRIKPPFPAIEGAFRKPTIVNNVETLACVTQIVKRGNDWFKSIGVPPDPKNPRDAGSYGPKLYTLAGHVEQAGVRRAADGHHDPRTGREARRRRVEGPQGEGREPRRPQHGLHRLQRAAEGRGRQDRVRHPARLQRPRQGRLPRSRHRGGHGHRRPDEHGRRAAQHLPVLRARELRAVYAVPRGHRVDAEDHRPPAPRAGPARRPRHSGRRRPTESASCPARRSAAWPTAPAGR